MEVHHQNHSQHGHVPKRLREHFYEFFMLFLAVTAGFYAENIREKFVERNKEREYMQSLVADLRQDSEQMNNALMALKSVAPGLDSLAGTCCNISTNDSVMRSLYDLNARYLRLIPLTFSDRTSSQLKNSGSMRLIRNKEVADSILNYWQGIDYYNYVSPLNENFRRKARELSFKIFDYSNYDPKTVFERNGLNNQKPRLLNDDKALMSEYTNYVRAYRTTQVYYYYPPIVRLQRQGQNLIALIKKEYDVE